MGAVFAPMNGFPDIVSPCPVREQLTSLMDGDVCRQCNSRVHKLDTMTRPQRLRLLAGAREGLCVRFRAPLAVAAMAVAVSALPAAAEDVAAPPPAADEAGESYDEIIVGGARILSADERRQAELEAYWEEQEERARLRHEAKKRAKAQRKVG